MACCTRFCESITDKEKEKALDILRMYLSDKEISKIYPELIKEGTCSRCDDD